MSTRTILDIAEATGVAPTAAMHVLHGGRYSIRLPEASKTLIHEEADRRGYVPCEQDLERHLARAHSILLTMPEFFKVSGDSQYFATLMEGAMTAAFERGCTLAVAPGSQQADILNITRDGQHDGVVWSMIYDEDMVADAFVCKHLPVVVLHADPNSIPPCAASVECDNQQGIELAVEHLIALGHERIAFVRYEGGNQREFRIREEAMVKALAKHGLTPFQTIGFNPGSHQPSLRTLVEQGLTAVVCGSEALAGEILKAAANEALWLPDQLSVIGFDSTFYCETTSPKLTAVRQPLLEMGYSAVASLIDHSAGFLDAIPHRRFECTLDVRDSTGPPIGF